MFSNNIREIRKKMMLSQTKLACLVGMAESTLSDLELGKRLPWPKARANLAKVLGVPETDIFPKKRGK